MNNNKNALAISLIMAAAASTVLIYSAFHPDISYAVLSIFIITTILLWIITSVVNYLYNRCRTSIDTGDIADISENLNTEIVIWTNDCSAVFMNKKMRNLLGIDISDDFNHEETIMKIFGIENVRPENIEKVISGQIGESFFTDADGNTTCIAWSTSLFKQNKNYSLYMSTGFNLTEIKNMQADLKSVNDRFSLAMELSETGVLISTNNSDYYISPEMMHMLGLEKSSISHRELRSLVHPNERLVFDSCIKRLSSVENTDEEVQNIEMRLKSSDGSYRWYSYRFKAVFLNGMMHPILGGAFLDITREREKDELIERLAYLDDVTGIANRNRLVQTGQETFEGCRHLGYSYWIIVLDIDRFHIINDTCGYESGNTLLRDFAHLLYKYVSAGGLAARISGDNFALIMRDYGDSELPSRTAMSIQEDMKRLAVNEFSALKLSCSAGYSKMPEDGKSFLDVLEHAEFALKSVTDSQNGICAYDPNMHDSIIGSTELEKALSDAIDNNELQLFYQPKINLSDGKIMGVEALVRWIKPDGTIVSPDSFVPVAERSELIGRISEFVLNEGCRQNVMWQKMGYPNIVMSINFSSYDFYQKDLKEKVFDALVKSGLEAQWLEIELTERLALNDVEFAVSHMNKLRELGVKLAMDDFGTGYSSLSYIQLLPITLLKLDRSFVIDIEHDNIAFEIVSSVIRIAKSKKIETIAEGIENGAQAKILREAGCDFGQGYLYGKPMPAQDMEKFFEKNAEERLVF